ncbi:type I-B CRISPR-associated protein Cas7/Cst2/DevR [Paenibacillus cisolokensis]|uniref:type I-B CRISPR-associated protein Cas7/Cst2/DevR n=1 Tax=Paenibacillus cisolokensis TaxID=1658519 RepID=UPI003D2C2DA9
MGKTLTLSVIFQGSSLNFGEGTANISELKKYHRGNGEVYTFASRQSIRYDIVRLGNELFGWNLDTVDKSKGVIQFKENVTIAESVEMDLFGYLKTGNPSKKRAAVARLSHALSLEPYKGDMEFLNNMGLAERLPKESPNIANLEQHQSFYAYHLSVDLDKVGVDGDLVLSTDERIRRVKQLLDVLKVLNRDIKGRRENLAPLFIVGGVYDVSNPFFLGRLQLTGNSKGWWLQMEPLQDALNTTWNEISVRDRTRLGVVSGWLANEAIIRDQLGDQSGSVEQFFAWIGKEVESAIGA